MQRLLDSRPLTSLTIAMAIRPFTTPLKTSANLGGQSEHFEVRDTLPIGRNCRRFSYRAAMGARRRALNARLQLNESARSPQHNLEEHRLGRCGPDIVFVGLSVPDPQPAQQTISTVGLGLQPPT